LSAKVLVLGGAGYIGSHMVKRLAQAGCEATAFDNLSTGHRAAVPGARFVQGDIRRREDLDRVLGETRFDAVMHFAGCCYVGESVAEPGKYYENNVTGTVNLLEAMRAAGPRRLVFSSSCTTYGDPQKLPLDESHSQNPVSPYGMTKYLAERAMADYGRAYGFQTVALRYFNAAGCDPEGDLGERHEPETHLIPLVLLEALRVRAGGDARASGLRINGGDFETPDGTCVRDYVHVNDLCEAHLLAMHRLLGGNAPAFEAFNLGTGQGYSVRQVIDACVRVTGIELHPNVGPRRPGDPPALVADATRARKVLKWSPAVGDLEGIIGTAWAWFSRR